jgi:hypothetical protein
MRMYLNGRPGLRGTDFAVVIAALEARVAALESA